MNKLLALALLLMLAGCVSQPPQTPQSNTGNANSSPNNDPSTGAVPYSLALEGFSIAGFPGLHSAVIAGAPEKLLMIGGRRNGLHNFPSDRLSPSKSNSNSNSNANSNSNSNAQTQTPAFPKTEANDTVYALDLKNRTLLGSAQVGMLPPKIVKQFTATNTQYELLNGWLYVIGGYGTDPQKGTLTTLGYVTVVNFDALADAVINKKPLDTAFAAANIVQFEHPALAITGGELDLLPDASAPGGNDFVLAFGQQFDGEYTTGGGISSQQYSDGVRVFQFTYPANSAKPSAVKFVTAVPNPPGTQMDPENPYHRRDYTMKPSVDASGNRRLVAYGGVFKGGRIEGFLNPVFISPGTNTVTLTPNTATSQLLSQYDTASVQFFDSGSGTVYTTFFGGISQYYWDEASHALKRDPLNLNKQAGSKDGLPFINSVSTLRMPTGNDTGIQYLHTGQAFPPAASVPTCSNTPAPYGGTETKFVIASGAPQVTDGVLQLNGITGSPVIGYMVGGILATAPYPNGATCASGMFYQVTLTPNQPTATTQLQVPAGQ